ncbi:MAG: sensor histidine kinase [Bacteroidales bacterium]|nr:sensor histidine kinase [Bacteroidales bacterium]MCF8386609.1 sensor histidine kinase [Bacteroidales bacterium]MCF8397725.1 sensor histidine kinase [Bacteroidales bacterium]
MRLIKTLFFLVIISQAASQQSLVDSMIELNQKLQNEEKVNNLINISRQYFIEGDSLSEYYAREAIHEAGKIEFEEGIGKASLFLGLYYGWNITDSALKYYTLSSDILSALDHPWAGYGYGNAAQELLNKGWYPESLESYLKALEAYTKAGDTLEIAKIVSSIGYLNNRMGNQREAIQWQKDALELIERHDNPSLQGLIIGRIGIAFDDMGMPDSANHYNQIALDLFRDAEDHYYISQWLSNIANTCIKQKKYDKAEEYLREALEYASIDFEKINILTNLGNVSVKKGKLRKAETYLDSAISKAKRLKQSESLSEAYFRKYELNKAKNDLSKALEYYVAYNQLADSMLNIEKTEQIARLKVKFETEQKEKQLLLARAEKEELAKEKALAEIALYNRNKWIIGISSTGVIAILFLLVFVQRNKRKAQAEKDAAIIKEKKASLDAVITAQEEERKRIARELHDGIVQQVAGIIMAWNKVFTQRKGSEDEIKLLNNLEESSKELREISHRMMPKALRAFGIVEAMEDLLENSLGVSDIQYEFEHFGLEKRLSEKIELTLFRIVQESVNNILKHSEASKVNLQLYISGKDVILMIEDDGKGLPAKLEKKGIGLRNIESRTDALNGKVSFENGPEGGLITTVRIPIEHQS